MEEIKKCNLCGMCNSVCPVFAVKKKETHSNRHKAFLIREKRQTKTVFKMLLDGSAKRACPASIDLDEALLKTRASLVLKGTEPATGREIADNLRRYGNPIGKNKKLNYFC